jgi:hypothetical protein
LGSNDTISGLGAPDGNAATVPGDDELFGGDGSDNLFCGAGSDLLWGGEEGRLGSTPNTVLGLQDRTLKRFIAASGPSSKTASTASAARGTVSRTTASILPST